MHLDPELQALVEAGRFDALEDRWLERLESAPDDPEFFLAALDGLVRGGQEARAEPLVQFLIEALASDGDAALAFVQPALGIWPQSAPLRTALFAALRRAYADRPSLDRLLAHFKVAEAADPSRALNQLDSWLRFDVGRAVLIQGRGLGRVGEINLALGSLRVEWPDGQRMTLKLAEAERLLTALDRGHFLLEKLEDPAALRALAESDPGALLEKVFESSAGPLSLSELRGLLSGLVPEERWASWWKRASADARLASTGGKRPLYTWSASEEAAEDTLRSAFEGAPPRAKLELARKHAARSEALGTFLARGVVGVARTAESDDASLALEAWLTLERLDAAGAATLAANAIATALDVEDPVPRIAGIEERGLRERAIQVLRDRRRDWRPLAARLLREETDTRTLALLYDSLRREGGEEDLQRILDDVLARPHTAPRLWLWLCREMRRRPELELKADWALLRRLLDALGSQAFRGQRAPLRDLFEPGELAEHLAGRLERDQAEQLHDILSRDLGLEEHRKDLLRRAVSKQHPDLRQAEEDVLYTTADGLERKRAEFEQITKRDIPRNAEEIRKAAAHGDLRENFEYKAARDRHEMLSSRAKTLHDELRRARALDPGSIDPTRVRVGTRVVLAPEGQGTPRTLVILGPWDSDPASGVVSYLAPAVEPLLGKSPGDTVQFMDQRFRVESIEVWRPA
jgi:transcription elongation GreA/GreB family factor